MRTSLLIASLLASSPLLALEGDLYRCDAASGDQREIEVVYTSEEKLPCEVQYTKEGVTETLWVANNQSGYCEEKAKYMADRLTGFGFGCQLQPGAK